MPTCQKFDALNDTDTCPRPSRRLARSKARSSSPLRGKKRMYGNTARRAVCLATVRGKKWFWAPKSERWVVTPISPRLPRTYTEMKITTRPEIGLDAVHPCPMVRSPAPLKSASKSATVPDDLTVPAPDTTIGNYQAYGKKCTPWKLYLLQLVYRHGRVEEGLL